jgi:hypothetical protein
MYSVPTLMDKIARESDAYIKDNLYQVLPELIYLIIRGDKTISVDNYVL